MYVEPWMFWLMLAPIAAVMAIYVGYLALLLLGLLSLSIGLGFSLAAAWLTATMAACTGYTVRATTWGLSSLVAPFKQYGPWLDYAVVAGIGIALSLVSVLWLAA